MSHILLAEKQPGSFEASFLVSCVAALPLSGVSQAWPIPVETGELTSAEAGPCVVDQARSAGRRLVVLGCKEPGWKLTGPWPGFRRWPNRAPASRPCQGRAGQVGTQVPARTTPVDFQSGEVDIVSFQADRLATQLPSLLLPCAW